MAAVETPVVVATVAVGTGVVAMVAVGTAAMATAVATVATILVGVKW